MKITALEIAKIEDDQAMLAQSFDLSNFGYFQRGTVKEMITFFSKTFIKNAPIGQRITVTQDVYEVHIYCRTDGLAGCVVCDSEYPARIAFQLITNLLDEYSQEYPDWANQTQLLTWTHMNEALEKYQNPRDVDQITKIKEGLDETTQILHKSIDELLKRGEKLDDLVEKSGELSNQSKLFYKQAKKANSCCSVA